MTPRPRTVSDEAILDAAARAVAEEGPAALTLARVAAGAGLSPAALVQRFGSKRGLLLALVARGPAEVAAGFARARAAHGAPLAALAAALAEQAQGLGSPRAVAHGLAFLQLDLTDPEFRAHARAHLQALRAGAKGLLDEAVAAGELARCDTAALARAVEVTYHGSVLAWAVRGQGRVEDALREDLATLLEHRGAGPRGRSATPARGAASRARRRSGRAP